MMEREASQELQLCCLGSWCGNVAESLLELQVRGACRPPSAQQGVAGGSPASPYGEAALGDGPLRLIQQ